MSTATPWARNRHRANEMVRMQHPDGGGVFLKQPGAFIGFWGSPIDRTLPDPHDFVDDTWDLQERRRVADYLDYGKEVAHYKGCSTCRICGQRNGSQDLGDGVFVWPEGLGHYIRDHAVRLPQAFIARALRGEKEGAL